jgi:hypothetical protein
VSTTTAVAAASTTVEASTAATTIAASATTTVTTRYAATGITARAARIPASAVAVSAAIAIPAAIAVAVSATAPVVPGTDADKEAASEPARSVVAVGCASVGVIRVIAPRASGRAVIGVIAGTDHRRANANSNRDLGIRRYSRDSGERQNYKYCQYN